MQKCFRFLGLVLVTLLLTHCSGKKVDENDPASMFLDAEEEIQSDHYQVALDKMRVIRNKFPYSKYSVLAQLRIADIYAIQENYLEAATAYEGFVELHPAHEKNEYASFRSAECYEKDTPTNIARDLSSAAKAIDSYLKFLSKFPKSPDAEKARQGVRLLRDLLAQKEFSIGEFYRKQGDFGAAANRYEKILVQFSETPTAAQAKIQREEVSKHLPKLGSSTH